MHYTLLRYTFLVGKGYIINWEFTAIRVRNRVRANYG